MNNKHKELEMLRNYKVKEFYPEDLIWEATRRNENYKKDYREFEKKRKKNKYHHDTGHPWNLLSGFVDPNITIEEIKKEIKKKITAGNPYKKVHPYWHLRDKYYIKTEKAVIFHDVQDDSEVVEPNYRRVPPAKDFFNYTFYDSSPEGCVYLCIDKEVVSDRIVLSINPLANDDEIIGAIKKKKDKLKKEMRKSLEKKRSFYPIPSDIKSYIEQLKKYDKLVKIFRLNYEDEIKINNGIYEKPESFDWKLILPLNLKNQHPCTESLFPHITQ